ncbi:NUDIX domain-containing protein [Clostridium tepidum]|jgi:ADP-ribose pyrophosphatase|uniref:Hydrolase n=1 Tax=Clostridium tepidum TaxID=1962263 RepID=A0A1S9I6R7_9CLOT|nr:NUDIX hydrolase [Clostridium tepidum]MCR1934660.1 NUDIX hydrolase [Clostridium tepidum]MDU6877693.1 NUDIX hydrolase [Clostridium botulinum]OOO62464.1 hydrolase [Clostridium tepidum]OOO65946.1 hydrolase [Clostridium tepidum]
MKKLDEKILYKGKWINFKEIDYLNNEEKILKWEAVERTNTTKSVVIVAKLVPSERYVFIKQYRPAIDNYVIGFPAGLVEQEDIELEAKRELEEETGYIGKVIDVSPEIRANPALLTDYTMLVQMEIDENNKLNKNPKQKLEPSEDIEVMLVPKEKSREFLIEQKNKGIDIGVGPWYIFGFKL